MPPPVVLIHGFPLDSAMWYRQKTWLEGIGYTVLTPDLPGFGARPVLSAEASSMTAFARNIANLIRNAGGRAIVGGFSMGGYVLLALLEIHPEMVAAGIFLDTHAAADSAAVRQNRLIMAATVEKTGMAPVADAMIPKLLSSTADPDMVLNLRRMILRQNPAGAAMAQHAMASREDRRDMLPRIQCPCLVVVGAQDVITPPAVMEQMAHGIPNSQFVIVPDAGHLSPLQSPDHVADLLAGFAATHG